MSYRESVLNAADSEGRLNAFQVRDLVNAHGLTVTDWVKDCKARQWSEDSLDRADLILTWLGY